MISHAHRCIFLHIPKTGGTSVEDAIWPPAAQRTPADLWMGFVDEFHNRYQTGGLQHLLATQVRDAVGAPTFGAYFKFAVVRNPWDKAVSQFAFMQRREDLRRFIGMQADDSFKHYLALIARKPHVQWLAQVRFVQDDDGQSLVDLIVRFETLQAGMQDVFTRLGLPQAPLPHLKKGRRGPYQAYYDAEAKDMVHALYQDDIRAFGYQFEGPSGPG